MALWTQGANETKGTQGANETNAKCKSTSVKQVHSTSAPGAMPATSRSRIRCR